MQHAPTIHFVFEVDDRRSRKMPRQSRAQRFMANQFIGNHMVKITNRIGLRRRRFVPTKSKSLTPGFHLIHSALSLFFKAVRARITITHDAFGIAATAAARFGAAGDNEARCLASAWPRE